MSLKRIQIPSPNHSSRGSATVRLIVLHTAEGARTIQTLGAFFANPASQVSSHAGADDTPNTIGEYVQPADKAWTVAAFNPVSVNLEMCAFAAWTTDEWMAHPHMLANCAAWIAEEAKRFGIPIVKLTDEQAQNGGRGVCQHSNLGAAGGGHHDCGPGFPIDTVLEMARAGSSKPEPHYDRFDNRPRMVLLKARREREQVQLYDRLRALQTPRSHPHRAQLAFVRLVLRSFAGRVARVENGKPNADYRAWRLQQLDARARGKRLV